MTAGRVYDGHMSTPTRRTRITATPMYPGSLYPEPGSTVAITYAEPATALAAVEDDGRWFCIEVRTEIQKLWADGAGGEMWVTEGDTPSYRIYVGEQVTVADIESWPDAEDYRILLSNMRGNGWDPIVRTRRGNFQPINPEDVVVSSAEVSR